MKARALALFVVAISALSLSGCGTVLNFASGDPKRYGGVARAVEIDIEIDKAAGVLNYVKMGPFPFFFYFLLADLCVCGVADTLTLPIVICLEPPKKVQAEGGPKANMAPVKCDAPTYPAQFSAGAIAAPPPPREPAALLGKPRPLDNVERP